MQDSDPKHVAYNTGMWILYYSHHRIYKKIKTDLKKIKLP